MVCDFYALPEARSWQGQFGIRYLSHNPLDNSDQDVESKIFPCLNKSLVLDYFSNKFNTCIPMRQYVEIVFFRVIIFMLFQHFHIISIKEYSHQRRNRKLKLRLVYLSYDFMQGPGGFGTVGFGPFEF
ncbi:hypothetical protein SLEP1_g1653 [Rubroshorea leprosula]|uniref:Uncharacterized protein n=1 Tax=Rubroshorea leprosula TaxID=152421 RepID=A0AAV5HLK9_9ROSI|nr:hypothetical protein SLEP1_g1653 [Rubroshorea leprosula]